MIQFPEDGGTAIDVKGVESFAVALEPAAEIWRRMREAITTTPETPWFEFTVLADPDAELPRRWSALDARDVNCLTYISPEHLESIETDVS